MSGLKSTLVTAVLAAAVGAAAAWGAMTIQARQDRPADLHHLVHASHLHPPAVDHAQCELELSGHVRIRLSEPGHFRKEADVGFRFDDGTRVQAECTLQGKDLMGDAECGEYTVYRSDFPLIPQGTRFPRPDMF